MRYISRTDVRDIQIDGLEIFECAMTGSLGWTHKDAPSFIIWATPNWENDGTIPFCIEDDASSSGEYINFAEITLEDSLEDQAKLYKTILVMAVDHVIKLAQPKVEEPLDKFNYQFGNHDESEFLEYEKGVNDLNQALSLIVNAYTIFDNSVYGIPPVFKEAFATDGGNTRLRDLKLESDGLMRLCYQGFKNVRK